MYIRRYAKSMHIHNSKAVYALIFYKKEYLDICACVPNNCYLPVLFKKILMIFI